MQMQNDTITKENNLVALLTKTRKMKVNQAFEAYSNRVVLYSVRHRQLTGMNLGNVWDSADWPDHVPNSSRMDT